MDAMGMAGPGESVVGQGVRTQCEKAAVLPRIRTEWNNRSQLFGRVENERETATSMY